MKKILVIGLVAVLLISMISVLSWGKRGFRSDPSEYGPPIQYPFGSTGSANCSQGTVEDVSYIDEDAFVHYSDCSCPAWGGREDVGVDSMLPRRGAEDDSDPDPGMADQWCPC
jgi:hypothetical protein